jgi:hypothetical protein
MKTPTSLAAVGLAAAVLALAAACDLRYLGGLPEPTIRVAAQSPIELPFREALDGIVLVTGRVNGKHDVEFILDTGAPVTVLVDGPRTAGLGLDTSKARRLGDPNDAASPTGVIQGGFSVDFGPVALTDLTAVVIPIASLPCRERFDSIGFGGVIGANLFRRFVVEVDWTTHRIRLHEPVTWSSAGARSVPITFAGGQPYVDATVVLPEGTRADVRLHLDTGMNNALALTAGAHPAFTMPTEGRIRTSCFVSGQGTTRDGPPVIVSLAGTPIDNVTPTYSATPSARGVREVGALGAGLFKRGKIAIDYPGRRLFLY